MVRVIDGYKEKMEQLSKRKTLVELIRKNFDGKEIVGATIDGYNGDIGVGERYHNSSICIFPSSCLIEVYDKSYFDLTNKFAKEAEKTMKEEFTVKTTYELD